MGRRKIKIEPIVDKHNRFICFSKRRTGLFKKANRLASRGFQIAVLVFSESGNAFVYGSPKVEAVVERFLHNSDATGGAGSSKAAESLIEAPGDCKDRTGKASVDSAKSPEEDEDSWNSFSSALMESKHFWWNSSVENLSLKKLLQFKSALEALLTSVRIKADSLLVERDFLAGFT